MAGRVAAGDQHLEVAQLFSAAGRRLVRFLVVGKVAAGEQHLEVAQLFSAAGPRLNVLFVGLVERESRCLWLQSIRTRSSRLMSIPIKQGGDSSPTITIKLALP